ncbi:MAG: CoA ester lyase [Betaproteobacteria bacterium]|nr:CoA ester lyase [Betaproteobacteria bacterium]
MTRSILFVPGDSPRKFELAAAGEADALVLDLEDSVAPEAKAAARGTVRAMLAKGAAGKPLWVRVNPLDSGLAEADLAAVIGGRPYGVLLPKSRGGEDVRRLAALLDRQEASAGVTLGATQVLPIATELGAAMFGLGTYAGSSPRLWGLTWGAEDLAADLGTLVNRVDGQYTEPFRVARSLCLFGAAAAGVRAIDTVCVDLENDAVVAAESLEARRDGFTGKMAIHPRHIGAINAAFTPSAAEREWARKIVAAFEANPNLGTFRLEGRMIDRPHLRAARRVLGEG